MVEAGWSPSVRLFEAAARVIPIISACWPDLEEFFEPEKEILISRSAEESLDFLQKLDEQKRREIGINARARVLREHTAAHRVRQLEEYLAEIHGNQTVIGV